MMTLAGTEQSFRHGTSLLEALAGWSTCHELLRQTCYRQADQLEQQREDTCPEIQHFRDASGEMEFQTDATKVNTVEGWRDMKIGVFAKREAGEEASPEN